MSRDETPLGEKAAGGLGALMLLAAIGFLSWKGFSQGEGKPDPRFRVTGIEEVGMGYLVRVEIRNQGQATAQGLKISGKLSCPGESSESSEVDVQYLPSSSSVRCGLFFSRNPALCSLSLRPEGYTEP